MIQEISDYLWIREILICTDTKGLIDAASEKEKFINIIFNISELMQKEDFVLVFDYVQNNIKELICKYRFDYNKDKEINDNMNYIIGRLNDYGKMNAARKDYLCKNWVRTEFNDRQLPLKYRNADNLIELMQLDFEYIIEMLKYNIPFEFNNIIEYISLVNLIIYKFPETFNDEGFYNTTKHNLDELRKSDEFTLDIKNYINKTRKNLKKVEPIKEEKIKIKRKIF